MGHRVTAIGHDPLLGLIFGTANIATSTLTNAHFDSFHIYTQQKLNSIQESINLTRNLYFLDQIKQ